MRVSLDPGVLRPRVILDVATAAWRALTFRAPFGVPGIRLARSALVAVTGIVMLLPALIALVGFEASRLPAGLWVAAILWCLVVLVFAALFRRPDTAVIGIFVGGVWFVVSAGTLLVFGSILTQFYPDVVVDLTSCRIMKDDLDCRIADTEVVVADLSRLSAFYFEHGLHICSDVPEQCVTAENNWKATLSVAQQAELDELLYPSASQISDQDQYPNLDGVFEFAVGVVVLLLLMWASAHVALLRTVGVSAASGVATLGCFIAATALAFYIVQIPSTRLSEPAMSDISFESNRTEENLMVFSSHLNRLRSVACVRWRRYCTEYYYYDDPSYENDVSTEDPIVPESSSKGPNASQQVASP